MKLKALVLAGGKGTRLRPITHTSAKQLIPIANKPILFYGLESIAKAGIEEVGIIVGDTRTEIQAAIGDGSRFGFKATYIPQEAPLGLAHAVKISKRFMGSAPFLMFLGDNLLKEGLNPLVSDFKAKKPNAQILVARVPNPQQFGVVEMKNGKVYRLVEKPKAPKSDLALVGVYLFDSSVFQAIDHIKPSARGELEITDAIQWLVDHKKTVIVKHIDGWWKDTGKLVDLLEVNRLILDTLDRQIHAKATVDAASKLEGRVVLEDGAQVVNSTIRGPAIIGKNSIVRHSYVGPYSSVYFDARIENSELEHSIILEHAHVRNIRRVQDSLVGQRAEIVRVNSMPAAYRIMVGDSSRVEVP